MHNNHVGIGFAVARVQYTVIHRCTICALVSGSYRIAIVADPDLCVIVWEGLKLHNRGKKCALYRNYSSL